MEYFIEANSLITDAKAMSFFRYRLHGVFYRSE